MEPPSPFRVSISNNSGRKPLPAKKLVSAIQLTLDQVPGPQGDVNLLLTTDEEIRNLNKQFRNISSVTDVLTFPAPQLEGFPLGEIAISVETANRQALRRGVSLTNELIALSIHGALHLRGLDDLEVDDQVKMQAEMTRIGELLGVKVSEGWQSVYEEAHS